MKKHVQIQYWSGIYTDRSLKDVLTSAQKEALAKCFRRTKSTRFHKLKGYPNIFAIKYNEKGHDEGRLLLTIKEGKLIVLGDLPDHNYKPKLKSLRKLLNFFNNNEIELKSDASSDDDDSTEDPATDFEELNEAPVYECNTSNNNDDDDDGDDPEFDYQPVAFEGSCVKPNVLVLDEDQLNVIEIAMPAIVSGPPGSGKTTIARTLLTQVGRLGEGEKIVYLARSSDLVEQIKTELDRISTDEIKAKIDIKTYNDFLTNPNDNSTKKVLEPEKVTKAVKEWLQGYFKNTKNKNKLTDSFKNDEDNLVQEFRIRSGFREKEYCDVTKVGAKQSLYHKAEKRVWINEVYKAFMADLATQDFLIADYVEIPAATQKYHTVIVDEAQDLSNLQLASIKARLAKSNRLCFFYGDGQSLEDDVPSKIFIKGLFAAPLTVQTASLTKHYRCSKEAMFVAGEVNRIRIKLTPKNKMEEPLKVNNQKSGGVKWIGKGSSDEEMRALRDLIANSKADVCIVAHPDKLEEAEKFFGAKKWQVRTTDRVKGLQYHTIIIYEPFTDPKFKAIDVALEEEKIEDSSFSSPLSQLFVSITRAENEVFFYSTIYRKNLEQRLKKAIADTNSVVKMSAEKSSVAELEMRAASLMRNREKDNAEAILKEELHYDEAAIAAFMKRHHLVFPADNVGKAVSSHELNNVKKASAAKKNQKKASDNKAAPVAVSVTQKVDEYVGCTKLFIAVRKNELAQVREILKGGVDVDETQGVGFWEGDTALDGAASYGHIEIAEALIEAGANLKILKSRVVQADGKVSYSTTYCTEKIADFFQQVEVCEQVAIATLKKTTMKGTDELHIIEELNNHFSLGSDMTDPKAKKLFLRTRWALLDKEQPARTVKIIKAYLVNSELVAKIGLHEGYTPLDIAILIEHLGAVEILLEEGANVKSLKNPPVRPPVSTAISRMEKCESLAKTMIRNEIVKCVKTMQSSDPANAEQNNVHLFAVMMKLNTMLENTNEILNPSMRKLVTDVRWRLYKSENTHFIANIIETAIFEVKWAYCDVKSKELVLGIIESNEELEGKLFAKNLLVDRVKDKIASALHSGMKLVDIKKQAEHYLLAISLGDVKYDALFVACHHGDLEEVNRLIKDGVKVNHIYGEFNESSALHEAARRGHSAIVGSLIAAGAHANLLMGSLALLAAVKGYVNCEEHSDRAREYIEVIMQLLSSGAQTWLLKDARKQYEPIHGKKVLLKLEYIDGCANSTKNIINKHMNALSKSNQQKLASSSNQILQLLQLQHRISALYFAHTNESAIELTVVDGLKEILSKCDNALSDVPSDEPSELKENNETTPLFKAAWQGQLEKVKTLLKEEVDVNIVEKGSYQGFTPLYAAARKEVSSVEIVRELLKSGANVELLPGRRLVDGQPVYSDLYKEDVIKILQSAERCERLTFSMIASAIDADKISEKDRQYLHEPSIIELIKQKSRGLMFGATPKDRETILLYVAQKIQAAIDEALLARDAVQAVRTSSPSLLKQYLMQGATTSTSSTSSTVDIKVSLNDQFYEACTKGDKTLVESLLGQGANVDYIRRDPNKGLADSAMFAAVFRGYTEIVILLIGAGVNLQAQEGGHVLFAAVSALISCYEHNLSPHQHSQTLDILVGNGANTHGLREKNAKKISYSKTRYTQKMIAMFEKVDRAENSANKHIGQYTAKLSREQKALLSERDDLIKKVHHKVTGLFFVDQDLPFIKKFMSDMISQILLPQPIAPSILTQYAIATSSTSTNSASMLIPTNTLSPFNPRISNAPR